MVCYFGAFLDFDYTIFTLFILFYLWAILQLMLLFLDFGIAHQGCQKCKHQ